MWLWAESLKQDNIIINIFFQYYQYIFSFDIVLPSRSIANHRASSRGTQLQRLEFVASNVKYSSSSH